MIIAVLMILSGGGMVLYRFGWYRTGASAFFAAFFLTFGVGCGTLPSWLLGYLESAYIKVPAIQWSGRSVIVLLGAGADKVADSTDVVPSSLAYSRIAESAALYRTCSLSQSSCALVVSGGDARRVGIAEAQLYRPYLLRLGVAAKDVILEAQSLNTAQNASYVREILSEYHAEHVVVVSSAIHLRRAMLHFDELGIHAIPVRSDFISAKIVLMPRAENFSLMDMALHECLGILRYRVYAALGITARLAKGS